MKKTGEGGQNNDEKNHVCIDLATADRILSLIAELESEFWNLTEPLFVEQMIKESMAESMDFEDHDSLAPDELPF
jgi:hypothetical protein